MNNTKISPTGRNVQTGLHLLLVVCLSLTQVVYVHAQCIKHLNAHRFLGAANVFHVVTDTRGYLWFCTNYGVVKYNGHSIRRFARQQGLEDNVVFNIFEDKKGRIWPFCRNGKYCFISGDSVHNESNDTSLKKLPHASSFMTYMADNGNTLYMAFITGQVLVMGHKKQTWLLPTDDVKGIMVTPDEIKLTTIVTPPYIKYVGDKRLEVDKNGIKISINQTTKWVLNDSSLTDHSITDMCLSDMNSLVVATNHGLIIIDVATKRQTMLLNGVRVSGCAKDITGNFWITTENAGVYVLNRELNNIHELGNFDDVDLVEINDDRLVTIKGNQLYEFVTNDSGIIPVKQPENVHNYYNPVMLTRSLAAFYDTWHKKFMITDRKGKLLLSTTTFYKYAYTQGDSSFVLIGKNLVSFFRLEKTGLKLLRSRTYDHLITAASSNIRSREVFFVSDSSLYKCNFLTTENNLIYSSPLLKGTKSVLVQNSSIYFVTDTPGYYSLSFTNNSWHIYYVKTGFFVNCMLDFGEGKYIASSDAADYIGSLQKSIQPLQRIQYPFSSAEYEHLSLVNNYCLVQLDGHLYYFNIALLNKHITIPRIYIERLIINGKAYDTDNIDIRNTMRLNMQLTVSILDFEGVHNLRYRLLGPELDRNWVNTKSNELTFILRKAGKYRLEITTDAVDGYSSQTMVRTILVHTPFLRSASFIAVCSIIFLFLCGATILFILKYRERRFVREYDYLKLEHRAINALLNPHFVFNTINNIQNLIIKSNSQDAADYLAALSRLIRQNLENLQYSLVPLDNEIEMIRRYIKLQNLRFEGKIDFVFTGDYNISNIYIPPLLIHTFIENAIVHGYRDPSVTFCIELTVTPSENNYLKIIVRDNGIGINHADEHSVLHQKTSMGIAFNQKRLDRLSDFYLLRQSITVTDLSALGQQGTEVIIILYAGLKDLF